MKSTLSSGSLEEEDVKMLEKSAVGDERELPAPCQPPQLLWVSQQAAVRCGQGSGAGSCLLSEVKSDAGLKGGLPTYSPHACQALRG